MAMGEPTIAEFFRMMQISTPNAAYKIGSLVRKGCGEDPVHQGSARIPPPPDQEVYRILQHQLLLPAHRGGARAGPLPRRGCGQAGADADGHQRRADAGRYGLKRTIEPVDAP